ncbi:hypothetical protein AGABI1DRAFT_131128 [Agaricus bisporus var. burnettii JB137-S8]|uniref:HNH nuclease domain-containing protein n=1 Tax=Agaricus bisporus var. burnettii (strain JB137-S8 / ATCC MYA-4627 / FGSC 10392) TaxID=597362 RepID=K5X0G1_AGABU|nr:uncharacterized protein AGABI1DRAFT_131128 [Agaricus bisporus var. burnettii JB137-S8]EKM76573.1 hypothetical protein AGABI1DRAFT_131128 [Agaricus bisporus var. burnettii JB137-S8]
MDQSSLSVSQFKTTPSSRIEYKYDISAKSKRRVDSADASVNQRHCLIENCPNERAVQYCHLVARSRTKNERFMTRLEYYWRLEHGELNLDTRYNIFFAGASLHILHDNDSWGLLPPENFVDQYHDKLVFAGAIPYANRETFPIIPNGIFSYRLFPLKTSMRSICIARQENPAHDRPVAATDFKIHVHPFNELPDFQSHLHPKFAIVELGRKLSGLDLVTLTSFTSTFPILGRVLAIFMAWTRRIPPPTDGSQSEWFDRDNGDGQSETSTKTGYNSERAKKRKRADAAQTSPTPSRAILGATRVAGLSHETLLDHEAIAGKEGWTRKSLLSWAESISPRVEVRGASEGVIV